MRSQPDKNDTSHNIKKKNVTILIVSFLCKFCTFKNNNILPYSLLFWGYELNKIYNDYDEYHVLLAMSNTITNFLNLCSVCINTFNLKNLYCAIILHT